MSNSKIICKLNQIFDKYKDKRICVLGTTCCGKTTLLKQIPGCVDLDDILWPQLSEDEKNYINKQPWTDEVGKFVDKLAYEKVVVKEGVPLFTTLIIDCDVVIYLDIDDKILKEHCEKRKVSFSDAKNMKIAVEDDLNNHKSIGNKTFLYLEITE